MIPQFNLFNAYTSGGTPPFQFNATFDINQSNEASLYNSISSEFCYLYGNDIVFIPKDVGFTEEVFGEFLAGQFNRGYNLRAFIEEMEAWGGQGDIYSKFGLQVTDECTIFINKTSFSQSVSAEFPKPSDLVYVTKSQKLFEISHIEDEVAPGFYHFGNKTWYKISCKLFTYNYEIINQSVSAGIPSAIQALDNLIEQTETDDLVKVDVKEETNFNIKLEEIADTFIDDSEDDPLMN